MLQGVDIARLRGVEIGPLNRPLIEKGESRVYYVDHCSTEQLKVKYAQDASIDKKEIVDVDYVWSDEPARDLLRDVCPLDYVVASHVIEHVPDLIGWLHEMTDTLREEGSLILAVPDKRFTFDVCRRISAMEEIRLAYKERRRRPGLRCVMDHFANIVHADSGSLWSDPRKAGDFPFLHDPSLLSFAAARYAEGRYVDAHCWVFTPWSFLQTVGLIVAETKLGLDLQSFQATRPQQVEFCVQLVRVPQSTTDWEKEAAAAYASASGFEDPTRADQLPGACQRLGLEDSRDLAASSARLADAERRAELAETRAAQLASRVAALESSTSWRMTAPMRAVVNAMRR